MVEWVTGHTLHHHLGIQHNLAHQAGEWVPRVPPLARERPVTILGLGALGQACAQALCALNFPVTGWSRTARDVPGVTCLSGAEGLKQALSTAQILILLLPDTPATTNVINEETLAALPRGACLINPGRGPLIDDDALLAALKSGHVAGATLDVFRVEPLPADHPYWSHPNVIGTPHIAAETRGKTAAQFIARNIARGEAGEGFLHLVDHNQGY